jgi:hypothetical protein
LERAESRTRQGIMRTLASFWEDIGGPEEAFVLPDWNDWFLQVGTRASPPALLGIGDDAVDRTQFKRNCFLLELLLICRYVLFENCSWPQIYLFFLVKIDFQNHPPIFNTAFVRIYVSINVAGFGTTYEVNMGDDCVSVAIRVTQNNQTRPGGGED